MDEVIKIHGIHNFQYFAKYSVFSISVSNIPSVQDVYQRPPNAFQGIQNVFH